MTTTKSSGSDKEPAAKGDEELPVTDFEKAQAEEVAAYEKAQAEEQDAS